MRLFNMVTRPQKVHLFILVDAPEKYIISITAVDATDHICRKQTFSSPIQMTLGVHQRTSLKNPVLHPIFFVTAWRVAAPHCVPV